MEGHRDDKLPPIIEEMLRWGSIIGNDYREFKLSRICSSSA